MNAPNTDPRARPKFGTFRRAITLASAILLTVAAVLVPAATAAAVSIDAECLGSFTRTFSPPITQTPQTITVTETSDYSTCVVGPTATGTETAS